MIYQREKFKIDEKTYDRAVAKVQDRLGSYRNIANAIKEHTGETKTPATFGNWFNERSVPVEYAALFAELTEGEVSVFDFYPWLTLYV